MSDQISEVCCSVHSFFASVLCELILFGSTKGGFFFLILFCNVFQSCFIASMSIMHVIS